MFLVRAIQNKEYAKTVASALNTKIIDNSFAFYACDLASDGETPSEYIAICQFYMGEIGEICDLTVANGRYDDEAVIVMLRAVMSFMHRVGIKKSVFSENAAAEEILQKSGYILKNGVYSMDLEKFYTSPCHYEG